MAYASASNVAAWSQNILGGASTFSSSTSPTLTAVTNWLTSGCAVIEATLSGEGYNVPPASGTVAYDWLSELNALYAAARVELSRTNITVGPGERTRGQVFNDMFHSGLKRLLVTNLSATGLSKSATGGLYTGGISISDKDSRKANTDRVQPRFSRGQFDFPGTIRPATTAAS